MPGVIKGGMDCPTEAGSGGLKAGVVDDRGRCGEVCKQGEVADVSTDMMTRAEGRKSRRVRVKNRVR